MSSPRLTPARLALAIASLAALALGSPLAQATTVPIQSCAYDPASGKSNPLGDRAAITINQLGSDTVFTYQEIPSRSNRGPSVVVVSPKREITLENTSLEEAKQILLDNPVYFNDLIGYESASGFATVNASLTCWTNDLDSSPPAQATLPVRQVPATPGPIAPRAVPSDPAVTPAEAGPEALVTPAAPATAAIADPAPTVTVPAPTVTVPAPTVTVPAPAAVAVGPISRPKLDLGNLADGNYRLWTGPPQSQPVSDSTLLEAGGALFIFNKTGDRITGNFAYIDSDDSYCVTGQGNNSTVSGFAFPYSNEVLDLGESFRALGPTDFLRVRRTRLVNGQSFYGSALLDLSSFSQINLGPVPPPSSCQS